MTRFLSRLFNRSFPAFRSNDLSSRSQECSSSLEPLESRIAPAAVAVFSKGTLLIQGNPDGTLAIVQSSELVGTDTVITTTVTDNSVPIAGTSSFAGVKNVVVKLDPAATDENIVSFELIRLSGSVEVLAPKMGPTQVQIHGVVSDNDVPHIGKSVLLKGGAAGESLTISDTDIGGGIVFPAGKGTASFAMGGNVLTGSNVALIGVNIVNIAPSAEVGGNLLITQKTDATESFVLSNGAKIDGNVVIFAGAGSTSINAYAEVAGNVFVNAGQGINNFNVSLTAKSLQYVGGSDTDSVFLFRSQISGSVTLNLVGGNNTLAFDRSVPLGLSGDFSVGKKFSVGGGSENDVVRLDSASYNVSVGAKAAFSLGNGSNVLAWDGTSTGTAINIAGGSGVDIVSVFGLQAAKAALNVQLSANNDQLALTGEFSKASLDGGTGNDVITNVSVLPPNSKTRGFETVP